MSRSNKNRAEVSGLVLSKQRLTTRSGKPALRFKVRSRRYGTMGGEEREFFDVIDVEVRGAHVDDIDGEVNEGTVVEAVGRLEVRKHTVEVNGRPVYEHKGKGKRRKTHSETVVVARTIKPLSAPDTGSDATGGDADQHQDDGPRTADARPEDDSGSTAHEVPATDGARELAREGNVDLTTVKGHGKVVEGVATITKADVTAALKGAGSSS